MKRKLSHAGFELESVITIFYNDNRNAKRASHRICMHITFFLFLLNT